VSKNVVISDDYHDMGQLLLLTIFIDNSKNWIIVKENITANSQNWLIAHP